MLTNEVRPPTSLPVESLFVLSLCFNGFDIGSRCGVRDRQENRQTVCPPACPSFAMRRNTSAKPEAGELAAVVIG